jgi:hypothetical protein
LLQLEDDDVVFLAGLLQVLIGHALLDQLTGEPGDLLVPELDGGMRLLKRGALPLELALCFLPGRASALEGSLASLRADCSYWSWDFACWRVLCSC